jgi:hypothetical protein
MKLPLVMAEITMQNKKRINLKIIQSISQHELSYLLEGLKKLDEFEFTISTNIQIIE